MRRPRVLVLPIVRREPDNVSGRGSTLCTFGKMTVSSTALDLTESVQRETVSGTGSRLAGGAKRFGWAFAEHGSVNTRKATKFPEAVFGGDFGHARPALRRLSQLSSRQTQSAQQKVSFRRHAHALVTT